MADPIVGASGTSSKQRASNRRFPQAARMVWRNVRQHHQAIDSSTFAPNATYARDAAAACRAGNSAGQFQKKAPSAGFPVPAKGI